MTTELSLTLTFGVIASVWDVRQRRIPILLSLLTVLVGAWWPGLSWHWESVAAAFGAMSLLQYAGGDRNQVAALCGFVPLIVTLQALIGIVIMECLLLETVGRDRSVVGAPFFPWCALVICARVFVSVP